MKTVQTALSNDFYIQWDSLGRKGQHFQNSRKAKIRGWLLRFQALCYSLVIAVLCALYGWRHPTVSLNLSYSDCPVNYYYRKLRTKSPNLNVSSLGFQFAVYRSQVLSREWRCSWSSADRRCSNYIWVINNLIAYQSASYIRDLTVIQGLLKSDV